MSKELTICPSVSEGYRKNVLGLIESAMRSNATGGGGGFKRAGSGTMVYDEDSEVIQGNIKRLADAALDASGLLDRISKLEAELKRKDEALEQIDFLMKLWKFR